MRGVLVTYSDVDNLKRLELEAGQREYRLRLVTDSVGLPIFHFDRRLRLRFGNRPFSDWVGGPADDLLGQPLHEFAAPDALAEMQAYIERALAGGDGGATSGASASRTAICAGCGSRCSPIARSAGAIGGVFAVINDIEGRRTASATR